MPIIKNGSGTIIYTQRSEKYDSGIPGGTGVHPDDSFAIADKDDQLKQIQFDASAAQGTNSTTVITTGAQAANSTIILTLPATSGTLGLAGATTNSFTTIQVPNGTSPVATGATDTLTLTSTDSSLTITGTAATDTVNMAVRYSNPGAGARSEQFGSGALAPYADNTAFGNAAIISGGSSTGATAVGSNATVTGVYGTAIGFNAAAVESGSAFGRNATASNIGAVAFGHGALASAERSLAIGNNSRATADSAHAIGQNAESTHQASIVIGYSADSTAANQLVIGGEASREIRDVYIGGGVVEATPVAVLTIQPTGGSGTDVAAGVLNLRGPASTGSAAPGKIQLSTTTAGSSGTTAQTHTTRVEIDGTGRVSKQMGSGAGYATVGGTANVNTTAVGNVGVVEDNLITYSLPANSLAANGDYIEIEAFGTFAATANVKQVKLYFGAQVIFASGAIAANTGDWHIRGKVFRTGAATQKAIASAATSNALLVASADYTTPAETLSGAITIKCTGEATANDDIVQEGLLVKYGQV